MTRVLVDAKPVANLRQKEKVVMYLKPGDHIFSAMPTGMICSGSIVEVRGTVRADEEITFRIGFDMDKGLAINATAF